VLVFLIERLQEFKGKLLPTRLRLCYCRSVLWQLLGHVIEEWLEVKFNDLVSQKIGGVKHTGRRLNTKRMGDLVQVIDAVAGETRFCHGQPYCGDVPGVCRCLYNSAAINADVQLFVHAAFILQIVQNMLYLRLLIVGALR